MSKIETKNLSRHRHTHMSAHTQKNTHTHRRMTHAEVKKINSKTTRGKVNISTGAVGGAVSA